MYVFSIFTFFSYLCNPKLCPAIPFFGRDIQALLPDEWDIF